MRILKNKIKKIRSRVVSSKLFLKYAESIQYPLVDGKMIPLWDYYGILGHCQKDIHYMEFEGNKVYGIGYVMRRYADVGDIRAAIEHGMRPNTTYGLNETFDTSVPAIFTFGPYRYDVLKNKGNKLIFEIGPYIHYASALYEEFEIQAIKRNLGRTLLVFPSHSVEEVNTITDIRKLIDYTNNVCITQGYRSVLVCMYFVDILQGLHRIFEKAGYTVVTAGRREDINFYSRLKAIISIADGVISEGMGTHFGYCVYLGKPIVYFDNSMQTVYNENRCSTDRIEQTQMVIAENDKFNQKIKQIFSGGLDGISKEQYEFCNKYWGFEYIKSPEELREIVKFINKLPGLSAIKKADVEIKNVKDLHIRELLQRGIDAGKNIL